MSRKDYYLALKGKCGIAKGKKWPGDSEGR